MYSEVVEKQNYTRTVWEISGKHFPVAVDDTLPIDGDLKGYLSGRSTLTFHTPPSYGAAMKKKLLRNITNEGNNLNLIYRGTERPQIQSLSYL